MKVSQLLSEADISRPLELRDVIKFFPNTYKRVFAAKWGKKDALTYHGHEFFTSGEDDGSHELGSAYEAIDNAVQGILKDDDFGVEVNLNMDLTPLEGDEGIQKDSHEFTFQAKVSDSQEVYLGYDPETDALYSGYDVWIHEDDFNEAWDREFLEATGEEFDNEIPEHEEIFNKVWHKFRDEMFFGMLFEIKERGGHWVAEEVYAMPGGFYKGIYRGHAGFKSLDLIDLRLS